MRLYQITKTRTHYIIRAMGFILLSLLLSSCMQKNLPIADGNPSIDWVKRKQTLQSISQWTLKGKAAFQSKQESGSAAFKWQQGAEQFLFEAYNPLGNQAFRLQGNDTLSTLYLANGKEYKAANSEELFLQTTGVALPLSSLSYWIRGIPDPRYASKTTFDNSHRLLQLQQGNWQIDFKNYTSINGIDLPRLLFLSAPLYKAKVMIYDWHIQ